MIRLQNQRVLRIALCLCISMLAGCGKGKYDKLVQTRIDQLNNPDKYGILIWKEVDTNLSYTVKMPKGEESVNQTEENGMTTEVREVVFENKRYQLTFNQFEKNADAAAIAAQVEQRYRADGYTDFTPDEGASNDSVASGSVKSLNLVKDDGVRARVEVVQVGPTGVGTLAVIASPITESDGTSRPGLEEEDCDEFFGSVKRKLR